MYFNKNQIFHAAVYLRLSREDGDKLESDSIHNQRELIHSVLPNYSNVTIEDEYVDDGYTGTNFERPAFKKMMDDAAKHRIDCIVVKDLSRLGRNYIETGRLLEKIFPVMGIRFIAINDHYDSLTSDDGSEQIIIPFKNLINDAYCKDISMKVRSQFDAMRKEGRFIGSFACYGYLKDPENNNHLVIDEYAGRMVRYIFNLKLDGYSSLRISEKLNELKVVPPFEYKKMQGLNFDTGFRAKENASWTVSTVNRILRNEIYTGTMVQGKYRKISYKVRKSKAVPESEWYKAENTHDAIVTREEFDQVQRLLGLDTRTAPECEAVYPFSGFVKCAACGQNMVRRSCKKSDGREYTYYHCSTYKSGGGCSSHMINEKRLEELVLMAVKSHIDVILKAEEILGSIAQMPRDQVGLTLLNKQISQLDAESNRYKEMKLHLYQDMLDGIVARDEYQQINERFSMKLKSAEEKCLSLQKDREKLLEGENNLRPWIQEFKEYANIDHLDRKVVVSLISRILVIDKDHVEVHFRFEDELDWLMDERNVLEAVAL